MKNTSIWLKRHRESAEHVSGFCCPVTGKASDFQFSADHYVLLLIYGWNCCVIPGSVKSMRDHRKHVCRAYEYDCEVSYANSAQIATCRAVGRQSVGNKVLKPGSLEKKVESRYCFIKQQWSAIRYWTEKQESMSIKTSTTTWHCHIIIIQLPHPYLLCYNWPNSKVRSIVRHQLYDRMQERICVCLEECKKKEW